MGLVRIAYPKAGLFAAADSGPGLQSLDETEEIEARIADWKFNEIIHHLIQWTNKAVF
mgnify:CR=1 FL=1